MTEYTAAFVGCGGRGRAHVEAYDLIDRGEPAACYAPTPDNRTGLAEEFGLHAYDDLDRMLAAEEPAIVHVATPPDVRVGILEAISEAGVPACTVEKPIAVGVEDWRALRDLEARTDTKVAVCHQFRWQADLERCREAIASGELGEVRLLDCSARLVMSDQGTHCLHYANAMNGDARIEEVYGTASGPFRTDRAHPGPDATEAQVRFENGVRALWTTGSAAPAVEGRDAEYQHKRAVAYADAGHASWEQFGDWEIVSPDRTERGDFGGAEAWRESNRRAQAAFHEATLDWLEGGDPPGTNFEHSLHEWKAVLALYASALRDEPIRLDAFDPGSDLVERLAADLNE
jgi:predicted dehydrogenase